MMKLDKFIIAVFISLLLSVNAFAGSVPPYMNYQGLLKDASTGDSLTTGDYQMKFSLYDSPEGTPGAVEVWSQIIEPVKVVDGHFSVLLGGEGNSLPDSFNSPDRFIEVHVGSVGDIPDNLVKLSNRQRIVGMGYAFHAEQANNATFGTVPIGSIISWHKNLSGVPQALPSGWVECNGQVISNQNSPLNGVSVPNLNGERRFLRGGGTSGTPEGHQANAVTDLKTSYTTEDVQNPTESSIVPESGWSSAIFTGQDNIPPYGSFKIQLYKSGRETRPANMSVVWIMRII